MTKEQQLHWRVSEPSNTPTMLHESQNRSGNQRRKKEKICLHCPAKLPAQLGQKGKQPRYAAPAPTEGRVRSPHKHAPQNGCETTKDVRGSVSSCSLPLCGRSIKSSPHSWMTRLQIDSLSHWTLHGNVFHSARFSAQRQLMPCFTRTAVHVFTTVDTRQTSIGGASENERQYCRPLHETSGWTENAVARKETWTSNPGRHE